MFFVFTIFWSACTAYYALCMPSRYSLPDECVISLCTHLPVRLPVLLLLYVQRVGVRGSDGSPIYKSAMLRLASVCRASLQSTDVAGGSL